LQIITSINPSPRTEIDEICDEFYQKPIEKIDLILFEKLKSGDIVFFDNSHRLFSNSEITVMFPDVLPGYRSAPPVIGYGSLTVKRRFLVQVWDGCVLLSLIHPKNSRDCGSLQTFQNSTTGSSQSMSPLWLKSKLAIGSFS